MKKFLFIIDDLYGGGAEKVLLTVASGLASRGHKVKVWLLRDKIEHEVPANIELEILDVITPLTKALRNKLVRLYQANKVQKRLNKEDIDILICCSSESVTSLVNHPNQYFWLHADYGSTKPKHLQKLKDRYKNRHLISVSKGVEQSLLQLGIKPSSHQVFWNPIDQKAILSKAQQQRDSHPKPYFICVAALELRKGHQQLLEAFAQSGVSDDLLLLGKGAEELNLKEQCKQLGIDKQVHFMGFQKNPYPYIKNAKALLLTSQNEGAPLVLVEALMLNTVIASMDCPSGPKEILGYAKLEKYLFDINDVSGFSRCIKELTQYQPQIEHSQYAKFLPENALKQFEGL
ncbi:glycosyltransferase [uncultured Vibrio sp.]|uniref:glycosyltransferase n=1 Tax=uncultured Vibrio sp. TaxID=114054 RepID=UPI0026000559|nr:glycosyltransferase [uncultured Vibrio sp.]